MAVPKLRFPGFKGEWEEIEFGKLFEVKSGFAFKLQDYVSNGVHLINGETIQHNHIQTNNINYLPSDYLVEYEDFKLVTDDIVLGLNRPITNNKLKIAKIPQSLNNSLLYQRAGKVIFKSENLCRNFVYNLLSNEIYSFVNKEAVGSDQPFISTSKLNKWKFKYTNNYEEQKSIGLFIDKLDKKIQLQQEKIGLLKEQKKGFMQKIFSQELRFKDEDGQEFPEWEEKKLSSLIKPRLFIPKFKIPSKSRDNGFSRGFSFSLKR